MAKERERLIEGPVEKVSGSVSTKGGDVPTKIYPGSHSIGKGASAKAADKYIEGPADCSKEK
jgi:hypothetical protein